MRVGGGFLEYACFCPERECMAWVCASLSLSRHSVRHAPGVLARPQLALSLTLTHSRAAKPPTIHPRIPSVFLSLYFLVRREREKALQRCVFHPVRLHNHAPPCRCFIRLKITFFSFFWEVQNLFKALLELILLLLSDGNINKVGNFIK